MFAMGTGMGLTMTPATNSIMSAVPRDKAGAGAAVNNTVRQVAGALGVAILGSLLAVVFRNPLGADRPAQLAASLDQPAAVVSRMPASAQVATGVRKDSSESIGGALEFAGRAGAALQQRASGPAAATVSPQQAAALRARAQSAIGGFVEESKDAFVVAMRVTSGVAGVFGLVGSVVAFSLLPGRREFAEYTAGGATARPADEPALAR